VTTIFLARHGETDWNAQERWQGHADTSLNERGREQARELAARLADIAFAAVYSSDLRRARETAEIVVDGRDLPLLIEPGLREIDVGSWQGLTGAEIGDRERADGETLDAFRDRVLAALESIGRRHEGADVLVVAHGGCVRTLQRHLLGEPLPTLENCGVYVVRFENGTLQGSARTSETGSSPRRPSLRGAAEPEAQPADTQEADPSSPP
jgi:2,3-bisphosphoglycerate-dependent phosphoglycerate mutase